ncbi:MAG: hypothetical protein RIR26_1176 [Pseudomonadota bacterium]
MTVRSPELAADDALLTQLRSETDAVGLSEVFYFLSQLQCIEALFDSAKTFEESYRKALHAHLSRSLVTSLWNFRVRLWLGFASLRRELILQLDAGQRDVLWMEFVLTRVSLHDAFENPTNYCNPATIRDQHLRATVESRGGLVEMTHLMQKIYIEQRRLVLKEFVLRVLPAAVLVVSSVIALSMAALFLHSLLSGT